MSCISLVGMPGAGKSTLGVLLAKSAMKDFVDTDVLIQVRANQSLQSIVDHSGYLMLRELEEQVLLDLDLRNHVIATGGSAVYSEKGMAHLRTMGPLVYLKVSLEELKGRIKDLPKRGIAAIPGQTLDGLYRERCPLYEAAADVVVECDGRTPEAAVEAIEQAVGRLSKG
ncbi:shikimate kinase [Gilvimarinus sp. F26214L]|uniref:shikimate kinase n=1 Tax=Gilvimarinus sp. DZF01 TaxID=3461371 RepID=UPI0040460361